MGSPEQEQLLQYVSLGVNLGRGAPERPGTGGSICVVRLGRNFGELDLKDARVWAAAASPVTRAVIWDKALEEGFEKPDALIEELEGYGLLLQFRPNSEEWVKQLGTLRLQVQAWSAGLEDTEKESYGLMSPLGGPLANVDAVLWTIWAMSDGRTLGEVSEEYAKRVLGRPTEEVLRHVARHLDVLLSSGVAALDIAPETSSVGAVQ